MRFKGFNKKFKAYSGFQAEPGYVQPKCHGQTKFLTRLD